MEERSVQIFIPYERSFSLVVWEEWLVGVTPSTFRPHLFFHCYIASSRLATFWFPKNVSHSVTFEMQLKLSGYLNPIVIRNVKHVQPRVQNWVLNSVIHCPRSEFTQFFMIVDGLSLWTFATCIHYECVSISRLSVISNTSDKDVWLITCSNGVHVQLVGGWPA